MDFADLRDVRGAIERAKETGDPSELVFSLRRGNPFEPCELELIADFLEKHVTVKRKRGRPKNSHLDQLWKSLEGDKDAKEWLAIRSTAGLIWALKEEYRYQYSHQHIVDFCLQELERQGKDIPDRERLEEYMNRPKSRR